MADELHNAGQAKIQVPDLHTKTLQFLGDKAEGYRLRAEKAERQLAAALEFQDGLARENVAVASRNVQLQADLNRLAGIVEKFRKMNRQMVCLDGRTRASPKGEFVMWRDIESILAFQAGYEECECGDYRHQHRGDGPCGVCCQSRAPWDGCEAFRGTGKFHTLAALAAMPDKAPPHP